MAERLTAGGGTRLVLAGAVLYLLEWVAILTADPGTVPAPHGNSSEETLALYSGEADALGFEAGWFSLVLIGRVLVVLGLRAALRETGHAHPLLDLAVAAMLLGVTLEVAAYGLMVAAGTAAQGGDAAAVVALDAGAASLNSLVAGPTGAAVLISVWAMWRSRSFPVGLLVVGLVAAVGALAAGLLNAPSMRDVQGLLSLAAVVMWVWMLWAGVLLWRRRTVSGRAVPAMDARGG